MPTYEDFRNCTRARWHDYKSRCNYMITLTATEEAPRLANIVPGKDGVIISQPLEPGRLIGHHLFLFDSIDPHTVVFKKVIMPDHVHFILYVRQPIQRYAWELVMEFIKRINNLWGAPLLNIYFHDRIVHREGLLSRLRAYIDDNPRKYYIKMSNPDLFTRRHHIEIDGEKFEGIGNIFLLDDFDFQYVVISSHDKTDELNAKKLSWLHTIENGGVLVSPFISDAEKKVLKYALNNGGHIIYLSPDPLLLRSKPAFFDECAEGRVLHLAPQRAMINSGYSKRDCFLRLNRLAQSLSEGRFNLID